MDCETSRTRISLATPIDRGFGPALTGYKMNYLFLTGGFDEDNES